MVAILDTKTQSVEWSTLEGFPTYHDVTYPQFLKMFTPESEDRYQVRLVSTKEADKFYEHPYSGRVEPYYAFENEAETVTPGPTARQEKQDFRSLLDRYLETRPLEGDYESVDIRKVADLILHEKD